MQYRLDELEQELDETTTKVTTLNSITGRLKEDVRLCSDEVDALTAANKTLAKENEAMTQQIMKAKAEQIQQMNSLNEANETLTAKEQLLLSSHQRQPDET